MALGLRHMGYAAPAWRSSRAQSGESRKQMRSYHSVALCKAKYAVLLDRKNIARSYLQVVNQFWVCHFVSPNILRGGSLNICRHIWNFFWPKCLLGQKKTEPVLRARPQPSSGLPFGLPKNASWDGKIKATLVKHRTVILTSG